MAGRGRRRPEGGRIDRRPPPWRAPLVLGAAALALVAWTPGAAARDGEWIEFHGWCPDSSCYAYTVVTIETKGERERRRRDHRLVELRGKKRPRVRRYGSLDQVRRKARVDDFVGAPAPSERGEDSDVRFPLDDGRVLTFELLLEKQLGYRVTATTDAQPEEVARGTYDDLYPKTDAFAYVSPDGRKLALLVYGESPWRVRGEVHFMRLPAPPEIVTHDFRATPADALGPGVGGKLFAPARIAPIELTPLRISADH